jgi:hypothetical protein
MHSLILQVLAEHLWYGNFEFATDLINFVPGEQGVFSIPKQVCSSSGPATTSLRLCKLQINFNAAIKAQDISWP